MTYANDEVRFTFHQLPTGTQVEFCEMEERLSKRGYGVHIDSVTTNGPHSEVFIHITANFKVNGSTGSSAGNG